MLCFIWFFPSLLFFLSHSPVTCSSSFYNPSSNLCHTQESLALLQFVRSLTINNSTLPSKLCAHVGKVSFATRSWTKGSDCCEWDGVTCDLVTGHVIGLDLSCGQLAGTIDSNSSLFLLHNLQSLNLAFNDFFPSHISPQFGQLSSLKYLNLSSSRFCGTVPPEIGHLSQLTSLDLSFFEFYVDYHYYDYHTDSSYNNSRSYYYYYYRYLQFYDLHRLEMPNFETVISNLTGLRELHLNYVHINSGLPESLANLSSLTSIRLAGCNLLGKFPIKILDLPRLQSVSISDNDNLYAFSPQFHWSSPLEEINFSGCNFSGNLLNSFIPPKSLKVFNIMGCHFSGQLPTWIWSTAEAIILTDNQFIGELPASINTSNLSNLTILWLSDNLLNGTLPSWLFALPSLKILDISYNQFTGQIGELITSSRSVDMINYSSGRTCGSLPKSNNNLAKIEVLRISANNLQGSFELDWFSNLKDLSYLDLAYNHLSLTRISREVTLSSSWPSLSVLLLSSCNISEFPDFLRTQENLEALDLSYNKIHGGFPEWLPDIGKYSLVCLNLSHNFLTGGVKSLYSWKSLKYLDLSSNMLQGSIPELPFSITAFSASKNAFNGEIPTSICYTATLQFLDLSHNSLSGEIPQCLRNISNVLSVLDLRSNKLHGTLSESFAMCDKLTTLDLNGNQLEGSLPRTLLHCKGLSVLDLGNNRFNDAFPDWLAALPNLQVLDLHSNSFHGLVRTPKTEHPFPKLQILDLSSNHFGGILPSELFKNFTGMMNMDYKQDKLQYMGVAFYVCQRFDSYYKNSITLNVKGFSLELERILSILSAVDLSNNKFSGDIPDSTADLISLRWLNLSHNNFSGKIPPSLGNLSVLESLDLSYNKLVARIPEELVNLEFLESFNVSENKLVGPIPQGQQFNTFGNDSYLGNADLCGFPLSKNCLEEETEHALSSTDGGDPEPGDVHEWEIILMGYGCGLALGLVVGYFVFSAMTPAWLQSFICQIELSMTQASKKHQEAYDWTKKYRKCKK